MNASQSGSSLPRIIGGVVILLIGGVLLYYLYDYWFNIGGLQQKAVIIPNPIKANSPTVYPDSTNAINLRDYIYTGGELSTSFWVYVTGMSNNTDKKHLISLEAEKETTGTGASAVNTIPTLIVALGGSENTLYVMVRDGNTALSFTRAAAMSSGTVAMNSVDQSSGCNVQNFEAGRWVNVVVVLNNNISDVYIDGKLARSCKLKNQWTVDASTEKLVFKILQNNYGGANTSFNGSFSNFVYYNYAISPDQVYRIYMAGPSGGSVNFFEGLKRFFGLSKETTPAIA